MPHGLADILRLLSDAREPVALAGLHGGARALFLARLARHHPKRTLAVIVPTEERAQSLWEEGQLFLHPEDFARQRPFPESSCLPYSRLSPEPEAWADRLQALHLLIHGAPLVLIASAAAAMRRTPPKIFVASGARTIRAGSRLDPHELSRFLAGQGYEEVGLVEDEGAFARRGGIVDLWPPTIDHPARIELDGERIASMRLFDPASQRSRGDLADILIIPVRDLPFDDAARAEATRRIRARAEEAELPARERRTLFEAVSEGILFSGVETFMPLFHEGTATIFDFLPADAFVLVEDANEVEAKAAAHFNEVQALARDTSSAERIIRPEEILLSPEELFAEAGKFRGARLDALITGREDSSRSLIADTESNADVRLEVSRHTPGEEPLAPLIARIQNWREAGFRVLVTCHTETQAKRLADIFRWHSLPLGRFDAPFETIFELSPAAARIRIGRLTAGFRWASEKLALLTDEEIFGTKISRRPSASRPSEPFSSFSQIAEGDSLVHEQHGIGLYRGLIHLEIEGKGGDFLLLEYLGGDKLYLPVDRLNLVGRYIGSGEVSPPLDRLGGTRWAALQKKVDASIRLLARELIDLHAAREVYPGFPYPDGGEAYEEFCAAFPYDETPDQARAIEEVMRDLGLERPADRLICGDVGYGKTEVAMRAAFRTAMAGKQVAVLVPTTVLAFQHHETFARRFRESPVVIESLSRFRSRREQKKILEGLARGNVDIVIGTHRLLQRDVRFHALGLVVIDEEHRFGVRHKERIKRLKASADVIALTATPIPRTLSLSLSGVRDISVITTPPTDRLSITTYVTPFDEGVVRQACLREMARGGQIFFVHNRVETIRSMGERLARLLPEARIVTAHGQMAEGELERVMIEFLERRADILLSTTIIESGLDIPNANTIIIHRADTMGLAQLYQLRGRVGRSNMRAVAYLFTPETGEISPAAKKRLTVLNRFTELGSGFQIAMHDLEFRGAGNILGAAQSGHIAAVGYELYARLLERAVRRLRGKKIEQEIDPELSLRISAYLPEGYVPEAGARIDLYRRLANRDSEDGIAAIAEELADRFGPLPPEAEALLGVMKVKLLARRLRIRSLSFDGATLSCQLDPSTSLDPKLLAKLALQDPARIRLLPPDRVLLSTDPVASDRAALEFAKNSLSRLATCVSETPRKGDDE